MCLPTLEQLIHPQNNSNVTTRKAPAQFGSRATQSSFLLPAWTAASCQPSIERFAGEQELAHSWHARDVPPVVVNGLDCDPAVRGGFLNRQVLGLRFRRESFCNRSHQLHDTIE